MYFSNIFYFLFWTNHCCPENRDTKKKEFKIIFIWLILINLKNPIKMFILNLIPEFKSNHSRTYFWWLYELILQILGCLRFLVYSTIFIFINNHFKSSWQCHVYHALTSPVVFPLERRIWESIGIDWLFISLILSIVVTIALISGKCSADENETENI